MTQSNTSKTDNMRGVNKVILIGNLGRDPEIQFIDGTTPMVKLPLATTETFKDKNGNLQSQTEWHNVILWRGLAELAQKYLHKGSMVYVEGRLRNRTWEDKDKIKRYSTDVHADNFVMLDKRKEAGEENQSFSAATPSAVNTSHMNAGGENISDNGPIKDDLPF